MNLFSNHIWDAEEYHNNSSIQYEATNQLLQNFQFKGNEKILDVGCGDGKITAKIASNVSFGSILGIDISSEMINFAQQNFPKKKFENLSFLVKDAKKIDYICEFDVIFSSFALQWLSDQNDFLRRSYKSLKPSGHLVATIPLGISSALEQSIAENVSSDDWSTYFRTFSPNWHFPKKDKLEHLLTYNNFLPIRFSNETQKVIFPTRESFEKYVLQWFSYLQVLPEQLKDIFFNQTINRYLEIEPILQNGNVCFNFSRLDIIAKKI